MFSQRTNAIILAIFAVLSAISLYYMGNLTFIYDFEAFFPKSSKEMAFYNRYRDAFGPDDNYILIGVSNGLEGPFKDYFLAKTDSFTREASEAIPHIQAAQSLTTLKSPVLAAGALLRLPLLHPDDPLRLQKDSLRVMSDPRLRNRFISQDGKILAIVLQTTGTLTLREADALRKGLDELVAKYSFKDHFIAGRAYFQSMFAQRARHEFIFYASLSALLILIILFLIFRKPWGILVSFSSVLVGMLLFIGFLGMRGQALDPMSNLFPILMIIVGVSDVIHLLNKYTLEQRKGIPQREAIRITLREVGLATFLTSLTTAIGFSSLFTSSVPPIRNFGVMASIGVFITYATVLLFSSSLMSFFPAEKLIHLRPGKSKWDAFTEWLFKTTFHHQRTIIFSALGALVVFLWGISLISTDTHIANNFPRNAKIRSDFVLMEKVFGGVRNFELAILPSAGLDFYQPEVIEEINKVENFLASLPLFSSPLSPVTIYKSINRAMHGNNPEFYKLPQNKTEWNSLIRQVKKLPERNESSMVSKDGQMGRVSLRFYDVGSDSMAAIRQNIKNWLASNTDASKLQFEQTGTALLFDNNTRNVRSNMFLGLGLAFLLVSLLMVFLFKNWKMVFISLVPNIFPLLLAGALLGFLGIELDAATSIIFAIAFGIAVDDTIHFLSKFRLEIEKGQPIVTGIENTFRESGKAISLTSIILFFGFILLITSQYPPTFYIGLLVGITLLSALIADLFLTPVLIYRLMGTGELRLKSVFPKTMKRNARSL